eukprot:5954469-Karenia_brevis.AAC.1
MDSPIKSPRLPSTLSQEHHGSITQTDSKASVIGDGSPGGQQSSGHNDTKTGDVRVLRDEISQRLQHDPEATVELVILHCLHALARRMCRTSARK